MLFAFLSKKISNTFLFILVCFSPIHFYAQSEINHDPILTAVEEMPSFPGGEGEMVKFLTHNLKYPTYESAARIQGKCFLSFVIEKDGSITNIKVLKGIPNGNGCSEEAIRVVKLMPKWIPGKNKGEIVRVQFNLPVSFILKSIDAITKSDTIFFEKQNYGIGELDYFINALCYQHIDSKDKLNIRKSLVSNDYYLPDL